MAEDVGTWLWRTVPLAFLVIGTVGNVLTIIVLTRPDTRKSSTAVFLTALAFCDIGVLYTGMLRWWIIKWFDIDVRLLTNIGCKLHWYFIYATPQYSSWILVAVTCERLTSIKWPHKVRAMCTQRSALYVVLSLAIIVYVGNTHLLYGIMLFTDEKQTPNNITRELIEFDGFATFASSTENTGENVTTFVSEAPFELDGFSTLATSTDGILENGTSFVSEARFELDGLSTFASSTGGIGENGTTFVSVPPVHGLMNTGQSETELVCYARPGTSYADFFNYFYQWMDFFLYFFIPACMLGVGEVLILRTIFESRRLRRTLTHRHLSNSSTHSSDKTNYLTIMLLTVNAVFIICVTPIQIFLIGMPYWMDPVAGFSNNQQVTWAIVNLLMYLNHSVNFILYFLSGAKFRKKFFDLFRRQKVGKHSGQGSSDTDHSSAPKTEATSLHTSSSNITNFENNVTEPGRKSINALDTGCLSTNTRMVPYSTDSRKIQPIPDRPAVVSQMLSSPLPEDVPNQFKESLNQKHQNINVRGGQEGSEHNIHM